MRLIKLIVTFSVILFVKISVSAQCVPPTAPTITGEAGPDHLEITWTVSGFDPTAGTQVWMSIDLGHFYIAWSNVSPSEPSGSRGYIGSNWPIYLFARSTNGCGTTDSPVIIVTTFDLPVPPIEAFAGPGPNQITVWSHYIGPPNHAYSVQLHGITPSNVDTNWNNFSDDPPYTWNVGGPGLYRFYATTQINPWESRTSPTVFVMIAPDQNWGAPSCREGWGKPVNVTSGNMYLGETDYVLPGVGEAISVDRTYNSENQIGGLFGHGWTTQYDENITAINNYTVRLGMPDGQAAYFGRNSTTSAFTAITKDVQGQITKNTDNTFTLTFKDGRKHEFGTDGRLLSQQDQSGNQTTLDYGTSGLLAGVTDDAGRTLNFTLNGNGNVTQISDAVGTAATYDYYTSTNRLKTVTYPDGSKYQFEYDTTAVSGKVFLKTVKDALGNVLETHAYDSSGRATTSEIDGGSEKYTFDYSNATRTQITDALSRVTKVYFDPTSGRNVVKKVEGVCGCGGSGSQTTEYSYDWQLNITRKTDALGNDITYTYDSDRNITSIDDTLGTQSFTYNSFGEILTTTDRMGGVTSNTYDAAGRLLTTTDPLSHSTSLTYTSDGQAASITDARSHTTNFSYDSNGLLSLMTDANGKETEFTYNGRGLITTMRNAYHEETNFAYDDHNRLNQITFPDTNHVNIGYDLAGRTKSVTDENGHETTYAYDPAYRLTEITDTLNHTRTFSYDLMSNLTSVTDPLGNSTNYEYDDFDRLKKVKYPLPSPSASPRLEENYTYDKVGNIKTHTDTAGHTANYDYDAATRLTKITDALSHATQFTYNARSQLTKVKDALNQEYTFTYDALGRQLSQTRNGSTRSYGYDAAGNRSSRTDYSGQATSYSYDVLNRLTTIAYPGSSEYATYDYDDLSRLVSATNQAGTVGLTYDNRGRLSSETDVFGHVKGYAYDAAGNRTALTLDSNPFTGYAYDNANRLTTLTDADSYEFTFGYDAADRLTSKVLPNGVLSSYTYDNMDRLSRLVHEKDSETLFDDQYTYNSSNQISEIAGLAATRTYTYDDINRLTAMTDDTNSESYTYDSVGNRTASHLDTAYTIGSFNRLTADSYGEYRYDANGSIISRSASSNSWDRENRLVSTSSIPNTMQYGYDALGRRVTSLLVQNYFQYSTVPQPSKYTYDGMDVILDDNSEVLDPTPSLTYQNAPGIDNKIELKNDRDRMYFLQDHLGSTVSLTDSKGGVSESNSYDSFGNPTNTSFSSRYQFTGREYDPTRGLQYSRERWYDPNIGRFISEDPIGFSSGGVNFYEYVQNNPANLTDPSGLWPFQRSGKGYPTRGNLPGTNVPYRMDMRQEPYPNMHVFWPDGSETVVSHKGGWVPSHGGRPTAAPPMTYRPNLRPVVDDFKCRVKLKFPGGLGGILNVLQLVDGLLDDYDRWQRATQNGSTLDQQMCDDYSDAGPYINTAIGVLPNAYRNCKGA
jgi:RHS repeat-associated protein